MEMKIVVVKGYGYEKVVEELEKYSISYKVLCRENLDEDLIVNEIRSLPPQIRGRVRYGKGLPLPLSRSGRLNVKNTCIILVYGNNKLIDVYPKMLGSRYIDVIEGIRNIVGKTMPYLFEEPLILLVSQHPEILGCNRCLGIHKIYSDIEIDVLLECNGEKVAVEVEDIITEKAVSQALRISRYFQKVIIVGLKVEPKALKAAEKTELKIMIIKAIERK